MWQKISSQYLEEHPSQYFGQNNELDNSSIKMTQVTLFFILSGLMLSTSQWVLSRQSCLRHELQKTTELPNNNVTFFTQHVN